MVLRVAVINLALDSSLDFSSVIFRVDELHTEKIVRTELRDADFHGIRERVLNSEDNRRLFRGETFLDVSIIIQFLPFRGSGQLEFNNRE